MYSIYGYFSIRRAGILNTPELVFKTTNEIICFVVVGSLVYYVLRFWPQFTFLCCCFFLLHPLVHIVEQEQLLKIETKEEKEEEKSLLLLSSSCWLLQKMKKKKLESSLHLLCIFLLPNFFLFSSPY